MNVRAFLVTQATVAGGTILQTPVRCIDSVSLSSEDCLLVTAGLPHVIDMVKELTCRNIPHMVISAATIKHIEDNLSFNHVLAYYERVNILFYHRVNNLPSGAWNLAVTPKQFEEQIAFFKQNYSILPFDGDWSVADKRALVITFDDGYVDFFQYALPILEKYGVPATVFISSGNIDTEQEFWWDELENIVYNGYVDNTKTKRYGITLKNNTEEEKKTLCQKIRSKLKSMTAVQRREELHVLGQMFHANGILPRKCNRTLNSKEIVALSKSPYIKIGSHTVTHTSLATETIETQKWELDTSKNTLESIINQPITNLAYPFGESIDFTLDTQGVATSLGYKRIATTLVGLNHARGDFLKLLRNDIDVNWSVVKIKKQIGLNFLRYE